jgi:Domain of unknown function (DUF4351)
MQQSVIYQEWREDFLQEGKQMGEAGLILRQLSRRIGELSPEMRSASATKVVRRSKRCLSIGLSLWARRCWISRNLMI